MKIIKYKFMTEINYGTEEEPNLVQTFNDVQISCTDSNFESNYAIAQKEAYNGEIEVEGIPEPQTEPTIDERVATLEESLAIADEISIELFENQMAQEDKINELYNMIGGAE